MGQNELAVPDNEPQLQPSPEAIVRAAFEAVLSVDIGTLRAYVHPDLEWTFLDPTEAEPSLRTSFGRSELETAASKWASSGIVAALDDVEAMGDRVTVVMHAPGLDRMRASPADDRNFHLVTVRDGRVIAIRACKGQQDLAAVAGFGGVLCESPMSV